MLARRWRIVVACALLAVIAAGAATLLTAKVYAATTRLFVSPQGTQASLSDAYQGGLLSEAKVTSYAELVSSRPVADAVIARLGLVESAGGLQERITATSTPNTVLLDVTVRDSSGVRAKEIADAVGAEFVRYVASLETLGQAANRQNADSPVRVSVAEPAQVPTSPVSPKPRTNLLIGLLLGCALGLLAASVRDRRDTTVRVAADIAEVPVLGAVLVDDVSGADDALLADPRSESAESVRRLRHALSPILASGQPVAVTVASAVGVVGRMTTSTVLNIASAFAQTGVDVAVVEAQAASTRQLAGMEESVGLSNVLRGEVNLYDAVIRPRDSRLQVLAPGSQFENVADALSVEQVRTLVTRLKERAHLVLLISPPLLSASSSLPLVAAAEHTILIARLNDTRQEDLAQAVAQTREAGGSLLGVVLVRQAKQSARRIASAGRSAKAPPIMPAMRVVGRQEQQEVVPR
jgi:succinoglycan biosynthesis transport protein ExoP